MKPRKTAPWIRVVGTLVVSLSMTGCVVATSMAPTAMSATQLPTQPVPTLQQTRTHMTATPITSTPTPVETALSTPQATGLDGRWYAITSIRGSLLESTTTLRIVPGADGATGFQETNTSLVPLEWSRDGTKLLMNRYGGDTGVRLAIWDKSAGSVADLDIPLTGGANQSDGTWSPDGKEIAFVQSGDTKHNLIHVVDLASKRVRFIAEGITPAWSPDGRRIAFVFPEQGIEPSGRLRIYDVVRGISTTVDLPFFVDHPSWSSDSAKLLFSTVEASRSVFGLAVLQVASSQIEVIKAGKYQALPIWGFNDHSIILVQEGRLVSVEIGTGSSTITQVLMQFSQEEMTRIVLAP